MRSLISTVLVFAGTLHANASESCYVESIWEGKTVVIRGVVDPAVWPQGAYRMTVEVTDGSNRSMSAQAGDFESSGPGQTTELTVARSAHVVRPDAGITARMQISDGARSITCALLVKI